MDQVVEELVKKVLKIHHQLTFAGGDLLVMMLLVVVLLVALLMLLVDVVVLTGPQAVGVVEGGLGVVKEPARGVSTGVWL